MNPHVALIAVLVWVVLCPRAVTAQIDPACLAPLGAHAPAIFITALERTTGRPGSRARLNFQLAAPDPITVVAVTIDGVVDPQASVSGTSLAGMGGIWFTTPAPGSHAIGLRVSTTFGCELTRIWGQPLVVAGPVVEKPPAPINVSAAAGNARVTVTWAAVPSATGYRVKRGLVSGGPYVAVTPTALITVLDGDVTNGTTYYYVVSGVNASGEGPDSVPVTATPAAPVVVVLPAPTNVVATAGNGQVTLSWAAVPGAIGYWITRGTVSGGPYTASVADVVQTAFLDVNVVNGTTYYYVIYGKGVTGEGLNSPQVAATPVAPVVGGLPQRLLQQADLVYQGAFLPPVSCPQPDGCFGYGGSAPGFNAARNSLFLADRYQHVAEITIPALSTAGTIAGTNRATFLQPLTDITEGRLDTLLNPGDPNGQRIGGLLPWQGGLVATGFSFYDGSERAAVSHFRKPAAGDLIGPVRLAAPGAAYVGGHMALVPDAWKAALGGPALTGQCCLSIINRTSWGPALFTFDPSDIGVKVPVPSVPLLYYQKAPRSLNDNGAKDTYDGDANTLPSKPFGLASNWWNGATQITGVVLPENSRSVLFFGRQGIGPFCYGQGGETDTCKDVSERDKGTHAFPYRYQVWAYDALDLMAVKEGRKQPWEPKPYAVWELVIPGFAGDKYSVIRLLGATYDPATGRIFVAQAERDTGHGPVIHVFQVRP